MPELPEVETIRRELEPKLVGRTIQEVRIKKGSRLLRDTVSAATLQRNLLGQKIVALGRRGKYLIFTLGSGDFLLIHLGMTGRLFTAKQGEPAPVHTHLRLSFKDRDLLLIDPRTFGRVFWIPAGRLAAHSVIGSLGPEPLDPACSTSRLADQFARRSIAIKAALLDQAVLAGVGNIYADEACFRAGVSPLRPAKSLTPREIQALLRGLRRVLSASIAAKGTTFRDYQWDAGKSGDFIGKLKVYGKAGQPCPKCGAKIKRKVVGGRSTCYCTRCQK